MDLFTHYFQIILLGIVEGVTEFLPISSTGHLLIAEHLLGTHEPDVFNVVIQAGAILAVVFIYWNDILDLLGNLDQPNARSYLLKIITSFGVTAVIAFILVNKLHMKLPETLTPVAWATLIGGLVIFAIEFFAKKLYPQDNVSWLEAIFMGLAQVVAAVFPGASRSGVTIMTGLAMGMKRPVATEFSFLVGIPTMFAASGMEIIKYRKDLTSGDHQLLIDIALGFIVSAVVAFFVVKWLLRFVQSHTFNGFGIYRVILGGVLLLALSTHALPEIGKEKSTAKMVQPESTVVAPPPTAPTPTPVPDVSVPTPAPTPATNSVAPSTETNTPPRALPVNPADLTNPDSSPVAPATSTDSSSASPNSTSAPATNSEPTNVPAPQN